MYTEFDKRMKGYELPSKLFLTRRLPTIIRIDGKAFHTFTKNCDKPFDYKIMHCMYSTAKYLCENIQGAKLAYVQSDEISLLLTDYDNINTQAWFDKNVQKMTSVSASMTTLQFNRRWYYLNDSENIRYTGAMFDSRVFNLPKDEVINYFIWRQQDAVRNSIQMVAQANFTPTQIENKNSSELKVMLKDINQNWDDLDDKYKKGVCITPTKITYENEAGVNYSRIEHEIDYNIPTFAEHREYFDNINI